MEEIKKKTCTGECKKELPATLEYFYKKEKGLYGLEGICKKCKRKEAKENKKKRAKDTKNISITISNKEYDSAIEKAKKLNMSINDYVKLGLLKNNSKYIICVDKNLTDNEAYELSKIGTNINQIAHVCNSRKIVYASDIRYLRDMIDQCWSLIDKMYSKIDEINEVSLKILRGKNNE